MILFELNNIAKNRKKIGKLKNKSINNNKGPSNLKNIIYQMFEVFYKTFISFKYLT